MSFYSNRRLPKRRMNLRQTISCASPTRVRSEKLMDQLLKYAVNNLFKTLLTFGVVTGGFLFLMYFWSIGYFPNSFDATSATALLLAVAITGIGISVLLAASLVLPGLCYLGLHDTDSFKNALTVTDKVSVLLFVFPMAIATECIFVSIDTGLPEQFVAVSLLLSTVLIWLVVLSFLEKYWWKRLFVSVIIGTVSFIPLLTIFGIMVGYNNNVKQGHLPWVTFFVVLVLVIISNWIIANLKKWLFIFVAPFILLGCIFLQTGQFEALPKASVRFLKFGDIKNARLILDQRGCQIASTLGVSGVSVNSASPETCIVVTEAILSRIGSEYYVQAQRTDSNVSKSENSKQEYPKSEFQFALPSSHVLSWSVQK